MATCAVLLAGTVTACAGPDDVAAARPAAPSPTAKLTRCPAEFDTRADPPRATRTGELVPTGATGALLCSYRYVDYSDVYPLSASTASTEPPSEAVARLNALPPRLAPGEQVNGCAAMGQTMYVIVLTYPNGTGVGVRINPNCASAQQDGAVTSLPRKLSDLLSAWPTEAW